ncbi:M23 family metallopeptidase [Labilithrix luteola]|uniref:M23 family metallopeptidase n=1 Tax=Labilithrix luteola TaxID=1391654 RepID=UPI000A9894CE|nr:M23 family metallopeptidase [Labilithrix luteola]
MRLTLLASVASLLPLVTLACAGGNPPPSAPEGKCLSSPAPTKEAAAPSAPASTSAATTPSVVPVDAAAADLIRAIDAKDAAGIVAKFNGPMREVLPLEKAGPWVNAMLEAKGRILSSTRDAGRGNDRSGTYTFKAERGEWRVELHLSNDDTIIGLRFNDPPAPDPEVVKSTLVMGLPFRGQWSVSWGGPSLDVNQHVSHKSQRRATDLVMVDEAGKTHRGEGKKNEDYYAYGQEILAVADGTVITVIDGVPENAPGSMNPYFAAGNLVIIKHGDQLYSVYAHLQPGKLRVKPGATVKRGAVLGLCGNAGNTSEPHLHFQLQDGPLFENSYGVEPIFKDVSIVRNGNASKLAEYTWLKGDLVGDLKKK